MEDIADALGVTKPFIYYQFASKIEILSEICEWATGDAFDAVQPATDETLTPMQRYEVFIRSFTMAILQDRKLIQIYFREELNLPDDIAARIHELRRGVQDILLKIIEAGVKSGVFEVRDPALSTLIISGMSSYAFAWYRDHGRLDQVAITEEVLDMALRIVAKS